MVKDGKSSRMFHGRPLTASSRSGIRHWNAIATYLEHKYTTVLALRI
jgi:hypothetical protein